MSIVMKNLLMSVWDKALDHLVGTIIGTLLTTSLLLEIFTRVKPITQFVIPLVTWRWSGWIALAIVLIAYWLWKMLVKRRVARQSLVQRPPKYYASHDRGVEEREFAGVIWRIVIGSNAEPSKTRLSREDVFAWPLPHAYCPECDYELERKRVRWYCMPCKKYYGIPRELRENTWEKIRRNYERLVVQWGYNNFGIGGDNHKPLRVVIREAQTRKREKNNS